MIYRKHQETDLTSLHKAGIPRTLLLLSIVLAASCRPGGQGTTAGEVLPLDRTAWLGSAEGWGLLGLPRDGGALTYRRVLDLEAPTWAPAELQPVSRARAGVGSLWIQLQDGGLAFYEYSTGHLRTLEELPEGISLQAALDGRRALVLGPDSSSLQVVGGAESWDYDLGGAPIEILQAGEEDLVAVMRSGAEAEILVLRPPEPEPLARRKLAGLTDLAVTAWGRELYYLVEGEQEPRLHGLTLPELEEIATELSLSEPGEGLAVTPSAHRIYVASGAQLYVFDRQRARKVGEVELPGRVTDLRFGNTGATLLIRLDGQARFAVMQVGVDSVLGVIASDWDDDMPQALPGGRLVTRSDNQLVLYELPALTELTRAEEEDPRLWLLVQWQPPRPRERVAQRPTLLDVVAGSPGGDEPAGDEVASDEVTADDGAAPGFYAVVLAARAQPGVEQLVGRLRSVGYPGVMDLHRDAMGVDWYRAMIGPYPGRSLAEEAARDLAARYGYKPWILSIEDTSEASPGDSIRPGEEDAPASREPTSGREGG